MSRCKVLHIPGRCYGSLQEQVWCTCWRRVSPFKQGGIARLRDGRVDLSRPRTVHVLGLVVPIKHPAKRNC